MMNNPQEYESRSYGLGTALAQDPDAMHAFGQIDKAVQAQIIAYVQNGGTPEENQRRMQKAVEMIKSGGWSDWV